MAVPDFQTFMVPVLKVLSDGQVRQYRELNGPVAVEPRLSEDDLAETIGGGRSRATSWRGAAERARARPRVRAGEAVRRRARGRPDVQAFVGALHGQQADRGVFITTSRFSSEAREYVERIPNRIVLIDGHRLAELMILHNVGVQDENTFVLKRVDEDFFEQA